MEKSPKGRDIEKLDGHAGPIVSRGNQITELGEKMITSAALLKSIADGASGQKGLAVEKLQDVVGDSHEELKLAGERYKPTGPVLVEYGTTLSEVQPKIKTAVSNCEEDWQTYLSKQGAAFDAKPGFQLPSVTEPTPEEKDARQKEEDAYDDARAAADAAYDAWKAEASKFDGFYDTWEDAFDKAAHDIGKANSGGIEDGFWDDLDGFVAGALEVLKWVGLAVAILGIIIGGPFLAALGAIIAIATLALTIYSFARGNSSVLDLVFAVVGVIPFGSLGKLFGGNKMGFLDDMAGGLLTGSGRSAITGELGGIMHGLSTGFTRGGGGLSGLVRGLRGGGLAWAGPNGMGAGNIISRLFTGQNMNHWNQSGLAPAAIMGSIFGDGFTKNLFGLPDTLFDLHNGGPA